MSLNITWGGGGWQKCHVTFIIANFTGSVMSPKGGEGVGDLTQKVMGGGAKKCRKCVTYYLNDHSG
jgi:hypothetical protein